MEDKRRPVYTEIDIQTDSVSNKKKNEAWGKLTEEYNKCSLINQNVSIYRTYEYISILVIDMYINYILPVPFILHDTIV